MGYLYISIYIYIYIYIKLYIWAQIYSYYQHRFRRTVHFCAYIVYSCVCIVIISTYIAFLGKYIVFHDKYVVIIGTDQAKRAPLCIYLCIYSYYQHRFGGVCTLKIEQKKRKQCEYSSCFLSDTDQRLGSRIVTY